jgi:hypothetical protein
LVATEGCGTAFWFKGAPMGFSHSAVGSGFVLDPASEDSHHRFSKLERVDAALPNVDAERLSQGEGRSRGVLPVSPLVRGPAAGSRPRRRIDSLSNLGQHPLLSRVVGVLTRGSGLGGGKHLRNLHRSRLGWSSNLSLAKGLIAGDTKRKRALLLARQ